ncbi:phage protein [Bacillus licheniformis WX-02]|nr:phage protein [Bacillus licheniformis WX-02]
MDSSFICSHLGILFDLFLWQDVFRTIVFGIRSSCLAFHLFCLYIIQDTVPNHPEASAVILF